MELVVVIVLDHREAELPREFEHAQPAFGAQRDGGRELVMRGEEDRADTVLAAGALNRLDIRAVLVEPDRDDVGAKIGEGGDRGFVGQRLDQHGIARLQQRSRGEVDAVLATPCDADIVGGDRQPALSPQHRRDRLAQPERTARVAILQPVVAARALHGGPIRTREDVGGKQATVRRTLVELDALARR
jgi:hypothetical protein